MQKITLVLLCAFSSAGYTSPSVEKQELIQSKCKEIVLNDIGSRNKDISRYETRLIDTWEKNEKYVIEIGFRDKESQSNRFDNAWLTRLCVYDEGKETIRFPGLLNMSQWRNYEKADEQGDSTAKERLDNKNDSKIQQANNTGNDTITVKWAQQLQKKDVDYKHHVISNKVNNREITAFFSPSKITNEKPAATVRSLTPEEAREIEETQSWWIKKYPLDNTKGDGATTDQKVIEIFVVNPLKKTLDTLLLYGRKGECTTSVVPNSGHYLFVDFGKIERQERNGQLKIQHIAPNQAVLLRISIDQRTYDYFTGGGCLEIIGGSSVENHISTP